jgi:hypothetical protein
VRDSEGGWFTCVVCWVLVSPRRLCGDQWHDRIRRGGRTITLESWPEARYAGPRRQEHGETATGHPHRPIGSDPWRVAYAAWPVEGGRRQVHGIDDPLQLKKRPRATRTCIHAQLLLLSSSLTSDMYVSEKERWYTQGLWLHNRQPDRDRSCPSEGWSMGIGRQKVT